MPDYAAIAQSAAEALAEYGAPAVLERVVTGDYDPSVGEPDESPPQIFNTFALRTAFKYSDIDGTNILATDIRLMVSPALATIPVSGDTITFDGKRLKVVNNTPLKPATVLLYHDLQCRDA